MFWLFFFSFSFSDIINDVVYMYDVVHFFWIFFFCSGLAFGMRSLVQGIFDGIVGIAAEPIKGAQTGSAKEVGAGFRKGFTGIFAKPIVGVLNLVSDVTSGVAASVNMSKIGPLYRIRPPRCVIPSHPIPVRNFSFFFFFF